MLLVASLAMGMASCGDDDPDYSDVTPPEVAVTHSISGRVTGIDGEGLSATVSMNGTSATTQTDGTFVFENVAAGTYTLKAEADGKVSKETSITVNDSDSNNPVWNVTLSNEGTTITANADGSANANVTSEVLKGKRRRKNTAGEILLDHRKTEKIAAYAPRCLIRQCPDRGAGEHFRHKSARGREYVCE